MINLFPSSLSGKLKTLWRTWFTLRSTERDEMFRERTIRGMILILLLVAVVLIILTLSIGAPQRLIQFFTFAFLLVVAGVVIHKGRIRLAGWMMVGLLIVFEIFGLIQAGYWLAGVFIVPVIALLFAVLLLPLDSARKIPLVLIAVYAAAAFLMHTQGRVSPLGIETGFGNPVTATVVFVVIIAIVTGIQFYLHREFSARNQELKDLIETLEDRVAARTRDLQVAADVSKQVATVLNLSNLLPHLVERTLEGFDLYHVSIFLLDTGTLQYEAGTGDVGQRMKQEGKQFALDAKGLVPQAARTQQPVLVNDVSHTPQYFANPYLPATKSEMALPLVIAGQVLGVLDLQSQQENRFGTDEVQVLTSLAEQLAVAIQNARLYAEQVKVAEQLRAVDQMKSQFLASMSHELRTPLNAILNFTEFVTLGMLGPVNEKQTDALSKALDSGRHLLALINDVLDMTKIESGMLKLIVDQSVNLRDELSPVIATAQTLLKDKQVSFVQDIDDVLPTIVGDKRRIRQILLNLISNASKFTEQGSVTLSVKNRGDEVLFAVIDTGPGIAQEDQEMIFEPFQQTETGIRHAGGTGLGLPISRRLAEAHGGRLWVESQPGDGAAFYLALPVQSAYLAASLTSEVEENHV